MAKWANDLFMDAAFDWVDQCDIMCACNAQPTTYTELITTFKLADVALVPDTDFTKANGDTNGRKVTVAAKSGVTIDTTGTATHVGIGRSTDTSLRYVTTCTSQALTAAGTVDFPAWDIEVADPT